MIDFGSAVVDNWYSSWVLTLRLRLRRAPTTAERAAIATHQDYGYCEPSGLLLCMQSQRILSVGRDASLTESIHQYQAITPALKHQCPVWHGTPAKAVRGRAFFFSIPCGEQYE